MTCPAIEPGSAFLPTTLAHIDCQARSVGAYGYGALSAPGSQLSVALTGILVLFVGFFGLRLMLGYGSGRGDLVGGILKIGIVLTLVSSWPGFRTVVYDVVIDGPAELTQAAGAGADVPGTAGGFRERLHALDQAVIDITSLGTGRLPGGDLRDEFRGYPLPDESGFGWGRVVFLLGMIAPFAIVRLGAGLLLALAPVLAPWLLFERGSGLFFGWLRALGFVILGSVSVAMLTGLEIAVLEPWARATTTLRIGGAFLPSAPTELLVIALAFLVAQFGILALLGRLSFFASLGTRFGFREERRIQELERVSRFQPMGLDDIPPSRAQALANSLAMTMRRERASQKSSHATLPFVAALPDAAGQMTSGENSGLGSSYRRGHRRSSGSAYRRDRKK